MLISLQKPALPPDGTATEKGDLSPRARHIGKAGSLARAPHNEKALSRKGSRFRKSCSPARAVHWRVRVSVLHDFPGGQLPAFTVLPALAIQSPPFPAKRNGGGSFVTAVIAGSPHPQGLPASKKRALRTRTQPRSTHHHSVWPPSANGNPTHFRTRQP